MGTLMDNRTLGIPETRPEKFLKKLALLATSIFFIFTGLRHLFVPDFYILMIPHYLPIPFFFIYLTGIFQVLCSVALLFVKTRKWAAYGLMAFLLVTLPVVVDIWLYRQSTPEIPVPTWLKVLSVPLQFALIFWVYLFAKTPKSY